MQLLATRLFPFLLAPCSLLLLLSACSGKDEVILATTTSTQDSGLLDVLVPMFEDEYGYTVKTIAVGSGQALRLGEEGEADVVLAHSPKAEEEFMAAGSGRPPDRDAQRLHHRRACGRPCRRCGAEDAAGALALIADSGAIFVSRGDESARTRKS
jgi:tungstate transport system substrate-binding protein